MLDAEARTRAILSLKQRAREAGMPPENLDELFHTGVSDSDLAACVEFFEREDGRLAKRVAEHEPPQSGRLF